MLKILHARLQHYVNQEILDIQAGFRKGRGTKDQITNTRWIIEKARELEKNIYLCFLDYTKAFDYVDHNKLWKTLKQMEIPVFPVSWETNMKVKKHIVWNNWLVQGWERSTIGLSVVTLFA